MRIMWAILGIVAVVFGMLCVALFAFQRSMIYFPQPASNRDWIETLQVAGAKVKVSGRLVEGADAVVYFGGNAEDVSYSIGDLVRAYPERSLYLMNYRGYGGSTGTPTEAALFADALVLVDLAKRRHSNVMVIGRSLGSGVATYVASQREIEKLVLVTPFDSIAEIGAQMFPYMPVRWLILDKYESRKYARTVKAPVLVIAAERDEVVSMARTKALLEGFRPGQAKMKVVQRAGHNDISMHSEYAVLLRE